MRSDRSEVVLRDRIAPSADRRQVKDGLLEVRSQVKEVHNLGHACPRDVADRSQLGLRAHRPLPNQGIEPDRERHQPRDAGHPTG